MKAMKVRACWSWLSTLPGLTSAKHLSPAYLHHEVVREIKEAPGAIVEGGLAEGGGAGAAGARGRGWAGVGATGRPRESQPGTALHVPFLPSQQEPWGEQPAAPESAPESESGHHW